MFGHFFHYLDISSQELSQKCVSGAYDIQNFLVLVSRDLHLIAVKMHYTKFTLWTPKLQILAKIPFNSIIRLKVPYMHVNHSLVSAYHAIDSLDSLFSILFIAKCNIAKASRYICPFFIHNTSWKKQMGMLP